MQGPDRGLTGRKPPSESDRLTTRRPNLPACGAGEPLSESWSQSQSLSRTVAAGSSWFRGIVLTQAPSRPRRAAAGRLSATDSEPDSEASNKDHDTELAQASELLGQLDSPEVE
jgi:hypothetical protein